ncbi:hypothetical protein V8C86DRAFT_2449017 [Haematococcus lacustris]
MLHQLIRSLWQRLVAWLHTSQPSTVGATGVLGLGLLLAGWYQLRGSSARPRRPSAQLRNTNASNGSEVAAQNADMAHSSMPSSQPSAKARALQSQLSGVRTITISAPGVLLEEWDPSQLQDSATARRAACDVVKEMGRLAEVRLLAYVIDEVGQAAVSGALEAAGLLGVEPGQIQPHRLLFCSTLPGKVSIVRQLEPDLHIEGHIETVDNLHRFVPQLLLQQRPDVPAPTSLPSNVGSISSLHDYFCR